MSNRYVFGVKTYYARKKPDNYMFMVIQCSILQITKKCESAESGDRAALMLDIP